MPPRRPRAASSPPTPCRTSTSTSFSSAGSRSTSASLGSPEARVEPSDLCLEIARERGQLGIALRGLEIVPGATPFQREPVRLLELLEAPADVGRLAAVGVDGGIGHPVLELGVGALELVDELVEDATNGALTRARRRASPRESR